MAGYANIPHDWVEQCSALSDAEKGRLFIALLEYDRSGEAPELEGNERFVFPALKAQMDRETERASEISAKRSSARKSPITAEQTATNENKREQTVTNGNKQEQTVTKANKEAKREEKERSKEKEENITPLSTSPKGDIDCPPKGRFVKPTVEEVRAFCRERGNNVDPQAFVDFYTSKGWKVGNQPMIDWHAAVRTWERNRAFNGSKSKAKPTYAQHTDSSFSIDDIAIKLDEVSG